MAEQDQPARVLWVELDRGAEPVEQLRRQRTFWQKDALHDRPADRVVAGIDREDAPMLVVEVEEARALALRFPVHRETELGQHDTEITDAAQRVHFVIAVEREAAARSRRPEACRLRSARVADAEEVLVHLGGPADVIDVAEVDRIMRIERGDQLCDTRSLVGPRGPVAGERDSDFSGVSLQLVDAVVRACRRVGRERLARGEAVAQILEGPLEQSIREEPREQRVRQGRGRGFRPRRIGLRLLLQIGQNRRPRQVPKVLQILVTVVDDRRRHDTYLHSRTMCNLKLLSLQRAENEETPNRPARGNEAHKPRILRSAQFLMSATVNVSKNGLALTSFSRVVLPLASALAMSEAASAFSATDKIATAPAGPAK